ncbi:hypothetical protein [Nocardia sp. X0981]
MLGVERTDALVVGPLLVAQYRAECSRFDDATTAPKILAHPFDSFEQTAGAFAQASAIAPRPPAYFSGQESLSVGESRSVLLVRWSFTLA